MHKNNYLILAPGFTLVELQIYLALSALTAIMVCQVALLYSHLYDKTAIKAQRSILLLAAAQQVSSSFSQSVFAKKKSHELSPGSSLKNRTLTARINNHSAVVLEDVASFTAHLDASDKTVIGCSFTVLYQNKNMSWYKAAPTKAFRCSLSS